MSMETLGRPLPVVQMVQNTKSGLIASLRAAGDVAKALDVPPSFFFEGPRQGAKVALYHTRNLRAGPRIFGDSRSDGEEVLPRRSGQLPQHSIAPARCLSAKGVRTLRAKPLGAGTVSRLLVVDELTPRASY